MFAFPSGVQGEKKTLFEIKDRSLPKASPAQLEKNSPKPAVKSQPRINQKLEREFSINLQKGLDAFQVEEFEASVTFLEKVLTIIDSLPHRSGSAKSVYKLLAQAAIKLENYEKLIHYQRRIIKLVLAEVKNVDRDELALERFNLGNYYSLAKQYPLSAEFLIKALTHYKKSANDDKSAEIYSELGKVYDADSEYNLALWAYQSLFKLHKKNKETQNSGEALWKIGNILLRQLNNHSDAKKYLIRANRIFLQGRNAELTAESYLDLGLIAETQADFDKAMKFYRKAQTLVEDGNHLLTLSKAHLGQGSLHWFHGDHKNSFISLKKSLEAAQAKGDKRQQIIVFNKIGLIYKEMDDAASAMGYLEKSLKLAWEIKSPIDECSALKNMGLVYRQDKNYEKSIEHFQQALEIDKNLKSIRGQSYSLRNLAKSYRLAGNLRESDSHISQAIELDRETGDDANLAKSLREKFALVVLQNKTIEIKSLYRELEALVKKAFGKDHPDMANLYNYQALLNAGKGNFSSALDYLRKELAIQDNLIRNTFSISTEKQKLDVMQAVSGSFGISLSLIHQNLSTDAKAIRTGLELALKRKGIAIDAQSRARKALRDRMSPEAQKKWDHAASLRTQLSHLLLNKPQQAVQGTYRKTVASLRKQIQDTERNLAKESSLAAVELKQRKVTVKAVAAKLAKNAALVEFVKIRDYDFDNAIMGDKRYIAFVLRPGRKVALIDLGLADSTERLSEETLDYIRNFALLPRNDKTAKEIPMDRSVVYLKSLYQKLWAPLESALAGVDSVHISPDGLINLVPFSALTDKNGQSLVERLTIAYLNTGRELIGSGETAFKPASELLLLANPAFERGAMATISDDPAVRPRNFSAQFGPLPGTDAESKTIPSLLPGPQEQKTVLIGTDATESAVKNSRNPKILHLATRRFFLMEEAHALTGRYENPLVRSGLAFAGANHANEVTFGDDGVLTSLEISGLALHGTELAVLSACETGAVEKQTGEGVFSLRRAFALAGARNLLACLWPVSAEISVQQMTSFYKHLEDMPPAKALRQTQLDAIENLKKI